MLDEDVSVKPQNVLLMFRHFCFHKTTAGKGLASCEKYSLLVAANKAGNVPGVLGTNTVLSTQTRLETARKMSALDCDNHGWKRHDVSLKNTWFCRKHGFHSPTVSSKISGGVTLTNAGTVVT